jgi:hypothetical protein
MYIILVIYRYTLDLLIKLGKIASSNISQSFVYIQSHASYYIDQAHQNVKWLDFRPDALILVELSLLYREDSLHHGIKHFI